MGNYFPAVITKDEWYRLRAAMAGRREGGGIQGKAHTIANIFSGLILSSKDGGMRFQRIVKDIPRLISANGRNGRTGDPQTFPFVPTEKFLLNLLAKRISLKDILGNSAIAPLESNLPALEGELTDTLDRLNEVKQQIKKRPTIADTLFDVVEELDNKRKELEVAIEEEKQNSSQKGHEENTLEELKTLNKMEMTDEVRAKLKTRIKALISSIQLVIYGVKKSKFKAAEFQIHFKAGGSVAVDMLCSRDKMIVGMANEAVTAIGPERDFRIWDATVQKYVADKQEWYLKLFKAIPALLAADEDESEE